MDRATNTVDVTGDVGPFTLTVGANTVNDADGLDIPLAGLGLSDFALTDITVTSADGSATFGAMAPLTTNPNQAKLLAKLNYAIYALSAVYNSGTDTSVELNTLLSDFGLAKSDAGTFATTEPDAATFEATAMNARGTPQQNLEFADVTYILPNMAAIMAYYNANPTLDDDLDGIADAVSFQENLLKVWWNKLDTANDAALNTLVEAQIKALYPDVNSVL